MDGSEHAVLEHRLSLARKMAPTGDMVESGLRSLTDRMALEARRAKHRRRALVVISGLITAAVAALWPRRRASQTRT